MSDEPSTGSTVTSAGVDAGVAPGGEQAEAAAPSPASAPASAPAPQTRHGGGFGEFLRSAALAWVVAILAVAVAAWFALEARDLRAQENARTEALRAGELAALQLTTFTGAGIDQWVEKTKTLATDSFAQELNQQYDQQLRADLRDLDVEAVGELLSSFVQRMDGEEALVFTVLRQTTRYPTRDSRTVEDEVRFEITLQPVNGEWRVSDAQLLSPTPPLQERPFLDGDPGGGG